MLTTYQYVETRSRSVSSKRGLASKQRRETEMPYQYVETRSRSVSSKRGFASKQRGETETRNRDAKHRVSTMEI
ncbi:MAG: hypothetical protein VSS75_009575 [Candidatus Parabeggiatoa sp.]|nr:hypothetical protein [Candidatus Parabeggiatoa sp.]